MNVTDAEAEEREERQRDAGDDVPQRRVAGEGQQIEVDVGQRRHREHGEDADDDDDDDRLGPGDRLRADDVEQRHRHDDRTANILSPASRFRRRPPRSRSCRTTPRPCR